MAPDCREELLKDFSVYDTTVDVVSSWESITNHLYGEQFDRFYFDRFPELESETGALIPDFTVFFNEEYGLIGEIKRTFPNDRRAIFKELDQVSSYDQELGLKNRDGEHVVPETCDIMVIIEGSSAPQIGTRLNRIILEEEEYTFSKNPVLIRYQFNQDALMSRYEFQRVTQLEIGFRDSHLDIEEPLSEIIGESGEYGTLKGFPKHFNAFKVRKPICNDPPPGPYLATFLWHKIFPGYLSDEQYDVWKATNGQKAIPVEVTADGLTGEVNDYMKDGTVRTRWIRRALDFLCGAELADEEEGEYEIRFMGLVQNLGENNLQEGSQELEQTRELADIFIRRFCEGASDEERAHIAESPEDEEVEEEDSTGEQAGLDQFL